MYKEREGIMDNLTIEQRKLNMRNIKSKNTQPELMLRKKLWSMGIRYRLHSKDVFGKPDIYIKKYKIAIFVDSDFWHGKLYQEGKSIPKTNQEYWIPKLERNILRDIEVNKTLKAQGWTVLRYWESELKKDIYKCVDTIIEYIKQYNYAKVLIK